MSSFGREFLDNLHKLAATTRELRAASRRIQRQHGIVTSDDIQSRNLRARFPSYSESGKAEPGAFSETVPVGALKSSARKRYAHKSKDALVRTPTRISREDTFYRDAAKFYNLPTDRKSREWDATSTDIHEDLESVFSAKLKRQRAEIERRLEAEGLTPSVARAARAHNDKIKKSSRYYGDSHNHIAIPLQDLNRGIVGPRSRKKVKNIEKSKARSERIRMHELGLTKVTEWKAKHAKDKNVRKKARKWLAGLKRDLQASKYQPQWSSEVLRTPEMLALGAERPAVSRIIKRIGRDKIRRPIRKLIEAERGKIPAGRSAAYARLMTPNYFKIAPADPGVRSARVRPPKEVTIKQSKSPSIKAHRAYLKKLKHLALDKVRYKQLGLSFKPKPILFR